MRLVVLHGVLRPPSDARLLATTMRRLDLVRGADVLDVFTGSGVLAVAAARAGARSVAAVDISRRACLNARLNAGLNGVRVRVRRGDLFRPVDGERFDLVLANPPYLPSVSARVPRGAARAWEGGGDGRLLVDRFCAEVSRCLRPDGVALVVHSSLTGEAKTLAALSDAGHATRVVARSRGSLGPIVTSRAAELEERGLLAPGEREEELIVVEARAPSRSTTVPAALSSPSSESP